VRPPRDDIAAPEFPPGLAWLGEQPASMAELTAPGPVLVHFFDFAQLNSVRTLPYLVEWRRRYADLGLTVLGVQAPRFRFGGHPRPLARGLERLGVEFPVALDSERRLWLDYGCEGWPSLFLWGRGGALRWFHFGEGEYYATEHAIQAELRLLDALRPLPQPMDPLRATDGPGVKVMPPTPEIFPGEADDEPWVGGPDAEITVAYEAGGAFATIDGIGELRIELDGSARDPLAVDGAGLYELAAHPRHEAHILVLRARHPLRVWSVSFAAGVP
jgi:hypothetical protein